MLIRYLASMSIILGFEQIYRAIWGSQLSLLTYLNTQPDGQPSEAVRPFYTLAATQYSDTYAHYSFESWWDFLKTNFCAKTVGACESPSKAANFWHT